MQCDCRVRLTDHLPAENIQAQILAYRLNVDAGAGNQVFLTVVYGNLYRIDKKKLAIGKIGSLTKNVTVVDQSITSGDGAMEERKGGQDYHVAGLD